MPVNWPDIPMIAVSEILTLAWVIISLVMLVAVLAPLGYWWFLLLASIRPAASIALNAFTPRHRFIVAVPAHDECSVIEATIKRLRQLDYPAELFTIHVVADHCIDNTAELALQPGVQVHEREDGLRGSKGAALSWLFQRILSDDVCDAVVIFDADTLVELDFLRVMDARLTQGARVIQGQHVICNPGHGWFAMLIWAMFQIDNRYQNLGRANLGWSAKIMGDSICFHLDVLRKYGWGEGLTDDFHMRQLLLLDKMRVSYEPVARGNGEAPESPEKARLQRMRWLRGTHEVSQRFGPMLLKAFVKEPDGPLFDGVLSAYVPSYSTLTLLCWAFLGVQVFVLIFFPGSLPSELNIAWLVTFGLCFFYPFPALYLERAPLIAYLIILTGPFYIVWRSWLALRSRYLERSVAWVRTTHGERSKN
jgi:1,2-diacylglycerol 3-beta-glucosyltransferase